MIKTDYGLIKKRAQSKWGKKKKNILVHISAACHLVAFMGLCLGGSPLSEGYLQMSLFTETMGTYSMSPFSPTGLRGGVRELIFQDFPPCPSTEGAEHA